MLFAFCFLVFMSQLQERLKQICEVSGLKDEGLGFGEADLDEDWDPVKYEVRCYLYFFW